MTITGVMMIDWHKLIIEMMITKNSDDSIIIMGIIKMLIGWRLNNDCWVMRVKTIVLTSDDWRIKIKMINRWWLIEVSTNRILMSNSHKSDDRMVMWVGVDLWVRTREGDDLFI